MKKYFFICFLFFEWMLPAAKAQLNIIPMPQNANLIGTDFFNLRDTLFIVSNNLSAAADVLYLQKKITELGCRAIISDEKSASGKSTILISAYKNEFEKEAKSSYYLEIKKDKIEIEGNDEGVFYGIQTLLQLFYTSKNKEVACCEVADHPHFAWRGMHLDVARHFFPADSVKKYLDIMALYKMNVFHWHLTDDQGWRIEIKKYPKLTEIGSRRKETMIDKYFDPFVGDGIPYEGFYTQEEIKDVVAYAKMLHITIVPEIEMPGHALAALAAYPEYSCTGGPFEVLTKWGVSDDVFCPKKETFKFLDDVLTEVCALFPGKYIHIGGDECPKERWKTCPSCQALMKKENLKDENELQSYFIRQVEKLVNKKGKQIIGWDEILEGGLAPNAAVMSWRGVAGGIEAAQKKHYVVMCPGSHCYFDHYQGDRKTEPLAIGGFTSLKKVYRYNPIPNELNLDEQKYIIGAQGNVWTEYIPTFSKVEYMALPRLCALSEVLWTDSENRDYDDFLRRLFVHFSMLDKMNITYAKSIFDVQSSLSVSPDKKLQLSFASAFKNGKTFYTIDGNEPSEKSLPYSTPLILKKNETVKAAFFDYGELKSHVWSQTFAINKATADSIRLETPPDPRYNNGGSFTLVDGVKGMKPWYGKEWLGWDGNDCIATVDLRTAQPIEKISMGFLKDEVSWIYLPQKVEVFLFDEKNQPIEIKNLKQEWQADDNIIFTFEKIKVRYIKIAATNFGKIPDSKPGAGEPAWLFADEISVY